MSRERSSSRVDGSIGQERVQQQYETPLHPCGFVFKIVLMSTWFDAHYIGLDGIEILDVDGRALKPRRVHSNHGSVRDIAGMEKDIRTEDNLLLGDPASTGRMWLAPYVRQPSNAIELVFDEPTRMSCIRFWNYSRTPARGARDIEIFVDDLLVYQGVLRQQPQQEEAAAPGAKHPQREAVLFTTSSAVVTKERHTVYLPGADDLVLFYDVATAQHVHHASMNMQRPMTALLKHA